MLLWASATRVTAPELRLPSLHDSSLFSNPPPPESRARAEGAVCCLAGLLIAHFTPILREAFE